MWFEIVKELVLKINEDTRMWGWKPWGIINLNFTVPLIVK